MKKSWIIVLAFVFLYNAVPAFSAPRPVPKRLCWLFDDDYLSIRLLPESKGKIRGVEYFDMTGSFSFPGWGFLLNGSAHRKGKNVLHLGFTGTFDLDGPGGGGDMLQFGFDVLYNLKTKEGEMSLMYSGGDEADEASVPIAGVGCSSLPKPLW